MDLGIKGKTALVCAASKGLGRGCAFSLAREGVDVVITARTPGPLEETAEQIRKETGVKVTAVACDITTEEGRNLALAPVPIPTSWSTTRAARRRAISATGTAMIGSRRWTPTC